MTVLFLDDSDQPPEQNKALQDQDCPIPKGEVEIQIGNHFEEHNPRITTCTPDEEDAYKSRVQFLTSGPVTVTNVVNDLSSLNLQNNGHGQDHLQSLDFDAEDSSLESSQNQSQNTKANTIRIQVNYPPD